MTASLEAVERWAEIVRSSRTGEAPHRAPVDAVHMKNAYATATTTDASLSVLIAEAVTLHALQPQLRTYYDRWKAEPVELRRDRVVPIEALPWSLIFEPNEHARSALMLAADARAKDHVEQARAVVDAVRGLASTLGLVSPLAQQTATGLGDAKQVSLAAASVLDATAEPYREIDQWIRTRSGIARSVELAWEHRLRTLHMPRSNELLPLGDRAGIASRWLGRVGLEVPVGSIRDDSSTPTGTPSDLRVLPAIEPARALIIGTTPPAALGAIAFAGAMVEGVALALPGDTRMSVRLGIDRIHLVVANTLGRRLFLEPAFVTREAGVDRGRRESLLLECLYGDLFAMRLHAAFARFAIDVLERQTDLAARMREYVQHALGSAPAPIWAVHIATALPELRSSARVLAALLEPQWRAQLRQAHDEDWFRNPRAGESIRTTMDRMRERGAVAPWTGDNDPTAALKPDALAARIAESLTDARR